MIDSSVWVNVGLSCERRGTVEAERRRGLIVLPSTSGGKEEAESEKGNEESEFQAGGRGNAGYAFNCGGAGCCLAAIAA